MNNKCIKKIISILQQKFLFVLLFLIILLLEIFGFNHRFFVQTVFQMKEQVLRIDEGTLYGFSLVDGALLSDHNDPNLTFRNIDQWVRYIKLNCNNPNEAAQSQIFFRRVDEDFIEENSILFSLHNSEILVSLPKTIKVTSLRFDLTNKPEDTVFCQGITLNPDSPFELSYFRVFLLLVSIVGLLFSDKVISPKISETIWNSLISNGIWFFAFLIILIGLAYPVTITYDSAHFLRLADHIRAGSWSSWDPIRNIGFPLQLFYANRIFGYRQDALLIPMILSHILLFIFCCQIALVTLKPENDKSRFLIYLTIFLFIGIDPTVVGYFHVVLTEFLAATIAVISCFMAIKLYQTSLPSKQFYFISTYFILLTPLSWHLKQPYIGAAYFPFFIVCLLMIIKKFSLKSILHGLTINLIILAVVFGSELVWKNFLNTRDNPMQENRQFSTVAETRIDRRINRFRNDPIETTKNHVYQYLASINYLSQTPSGDWGEPSLTTGFQNRVIAQRMFLNPGSSNKLYESPRYDRYTREYIDYYSPPKWLNNMFQSRVRLSNFLFTTSYLVLPFAFLFFSLSWIRKKNLYNSALIILSGTSLLNVIGHLLGSPIDRYLFMGYPLNLLIGIMLVVKGIRLIKTNYLPKYVKPRKIIPVDEANI